MITVNKANPTAAEERTSLVNASDGAGLHFDGAAGSINGTSNLALGSKYSAEFVVNYTGSAENRLFDINGDTRFIVEFNRTGFTGKIAGYDSGFYEICDIPDDGVFHLVVTVDGTSVSAYINGNLAGTATKNNSTSIDTVTQWTIGANVGGSGSEFEGTIYRARFWNKALSSAEVQTAYERADVDFADQYGSASNIVSGYDFSTWATSNSSNVNATTQNITGSSGWWRKVYSLNAGFKHRIRIAGTQQSGQNFFIRDYDGSATALTDITNTTGTVSAVGLVQGTSFDVTATYTPDSDGYMFQVGAGTGNIEITTFEVHQIGCVSDYQTQWANPTQSLTVQDASGNADGTCSASGVTQVQPVVQLNSTSARIGTTAATPADGQVLANYGKIQNSAWPVLEVELSGGSASAAQLKVTADDGDKAVLEVAGSTSSISGLAQGDAVLYATNNLQFGTNNSRAAKLTLDSSGNVGVGDTTPTSPGGAARFVEISGSSASLVLTDSDAATWEWISAGGNLKAAKDGSDKVTINSTGQTSFAGHAVPSTNFGHDLGTSSLKWSNVYAFQGNFQNGIAFTQTNTSATGASTVSSILDHYGRGLWTPTLLRGGSAISAGVAYSNQAGNYTRIGNVVYYWFDMTISTLDNSTLNPSSGNFGIGGLPFTSAASSVGGYGAPSFRSMTAIASSIRNNNNSSYVQGSATTIQLKWFDASANEISIDTVTTDLTTGRLTGEGFYFTS